MKTFTMWVLASAFGMIGCSGSTGQLAQGLSTPLTGDEDASSVCGPGSTLRTCAFAGPAVPSAPQEYSCTAENSLFGGWPYVDGEPQPTNGLSEVHFLYAPLEFMRDNFVANGKYLTSYNSEAHLCDPALQNGGESFFLPPGRYRFGVTAQPELTEALDLVADKAYLIRFEGHVGELKTTVTEDQLASTVRR